MLIQPFESCDEYMELHVFIKQHQHQNGTVFAACDEELVGQTLREGKIEFTVSERFYAGEKVNEEKFKELMKESTNANLVGKTVISWTIQVGLLNAQDVKYIQGVPHAIVLAL